MLKAFSKVFHKTPPQGAPDDLRLQPEDLAHAHVTEDARNNISRGSGARLRQQNPHSSGLGIHSAMAPQNTATNALAGAVSPNRNAPGGGSRLAWPHVAEDSYPPGLPNKRASLHRRMEQQLVQPRLHVKGPAQGTDGRFPLTKDNLEWHLRMIPPVKESKYERILKYIEMQQQAVAAVAELTPQQMRGDIDSSLLMGGSPMQYDRGDSQPQRLNPRSHYTASSANPPFIIGSMQQQQQPPQHQQQQPLQHYRVSSVMLAPPLADREITKTAPHFHAPSGNHADIVFSQVARPRLNNAPATQNYAADPAKQAADVHGCNEEDDDTPLAAINSGTNSRVPPPNLSVQPKTGLEKYASGESNEDADLPEAVVPTNGFRASITSFQSNMAMNLNTEPTGRVSFSNSNPRSASILESHYRTTPVPRSPTALEALALHMSTNSGSARHSSFPSAKIHNRPSLDAITPTSPEKRRSSADSAMEPSPLGTANAYNRHYHQQQQQQRQSVAVANRIGSDGEDDDQPLAKQRPMSSSAAFLTHDNIGMQLKHAFSFGQHNNDDGDDSNMARRAPGKLADINGDSKQRELSGSVDSGTVESAEQNRDSDSISSVPLHVVNQSSVRGSDESADNNDIADDHVVPALDYIDDDDDDRPLVTIPKPQNSVQPHPSLYISTKLKQKQKPLDKHVGDHGSSNSVDSDDDQPLSSLLLQPNTASDDLGSLPLPMPRHIIDPDSIVNMSDMINESVAPLRTSIGERPVSPLGPRGSLVRKNSSLSRSFRMSDHNADAADGIADYIRSPMPAKRRSNLSTCIDLSDQIAGNTAINGDPIIEGDSESESGNRDRSNAPSPQQVDLAKEMGRPWARDSEYNPSSTSLGSNRKTQRGSTLGQQLTEELHQLRMGLAHAKRDNDRVARQSWQPGSAVLPVQQPWLHKESTLSDTALPHKLDTLNKLSSGAAAVNGSSAAVAGPRINLLDAIAAVEQGAEAPKMTSSWSFTDEQRPQSTQPQRRSRWFGKGANGLSANAGSNPSLHSPMQDSAKDDAHPIHGSSLSSRFNAKLGKLKKTLKPNPGAV
ncbi:hypothetical protein H4217_003917 [Coemansia sp. RSA 1939]|nr:hypothetical protein H4217_003917 [Coemansia sp. RSA 1939]KAJ2597279.1 hypothetical protein EV177_007765 [Coemansia sp. RSA 1804]